MPQIDFDPVHATANSQEFDRLKLKLGESARILVIEKPNFAYVHELRAPKIVDGKAVMVEKERKKSKEKYIDYDMDFIGRPLCLGDLGTITDKGYDDANCPACARSRQTDEVRPPDKRYAMNVIRYALNREGALVTPFSCSCLVWTFTQGKFNMLVGIAKEYDGLVGRDLVLGPCTVENYQNFAIQGSPKSVWQTTEDIKNTVLATYKANRVEDVEACCGRRVERRWLEDDLDKIAELWRQARGKADPTAPAAGDLAAGMSDLLASTAAPASTAPPAGLDFADLVGGTDATPNPAIAADATPDPAVSAEAPKEQPKQQAVEPTMDFASLLNSLS